ncbi:thioesterase family protein [Dialister sp.]|uniref:thioesterase family protein n=1 Tax=Dialister sp. TaxID=1955814 RepID=UPI003F038E77
MLNLNEFLSIGQNAITRQVVQQEDCTDNYDNDFKSLLATPRLLHWMIDASIHAIDPYLPDEYASIGLSVDFVHTAPTSLGMTVTVHASIVTITEHDVTLDIKAWDEQGIIGHGVHKRAIVMKKSVLDKAAERARLLMIKQANEQIKDMSR